MKPQVSRSLCLTLTAVGLALSACGNVTVISAADEYNGSLGSVELEGGEVMPIWLDVLHHRDLGQAAITFSPYDIGHPDNVFDGIPVTVFRSAAVNPAFIRVAFTSAKTTSEFRTLFSSLGLYQWKVEKADTEADMDNRSGTWAEIVPWQVSAGDDVFRSHVLPSGVSARIYQLVAQRLTGDNYVHINEWGLRGLATIESIDVQPAALQLPHPSTFSYVCVGSDAADISYDLTESVSWSVSNPGVATVATGGAVTTVASGATEIRADFGLLRGHADLTVVNLASPPANFTATGYYSTAHLTWGAGPGEATGYVIYRRPASGSYPTQPTACVGPRQDHTDHGLIPGETYLWKIAAHDVNNIVVTEYAETAEIALLTSSAGLERVAAPKLLIVLYHGEMTTAEKDAAIAGLQLGLDWYYRNSEQRFFMDATWMLIDAPVPMPDKENFVEYWGIEADLRNRGVKDGQYDLCFTTGAGINHCYGGYTIFNGTTRASKAIVCGVPYPANEPGTNDVLSWSFVHEIHHAIDGMVDDAGGDDMLSCHFPWNYPSPLDGTHVDWGIHYDGISQIMRTYDDYAGWSNVKHGDYVEVWDTDGDAMADSDIRVPMDETRFGTTIGLADSDSDGLRDGREYDRYVYTSLDPKNGDTDGDGRPDGADSQPLYAVSDVIPYTASPPTIDGVVELKWSKISTGYFFTRQASEFGFEAYANYDANNLYLAFRSSQPSLHYRLSLDGSGHLGRFESDVRHPDADPGNMALWYGDVYADGNHIEIPSSSSSASVYGVGTIPGSEVVTGFSGGWFTTEVKIPRILPHGCGYTYFASGAPTVAGLMLVPGRVFGINVTMSTSAGDEFAGTWTCLFETHGFVDFTLSGTGDLDGDGLDAYAEGAAQTDPLDPDTDGDGMDDGWEVGHGLNPLANDANDDADGDGAVNINEFLCRTDPQNSGSRLCVFSINADANITISWTTVCGCTYVVETNESLAGTWTEVAASLVTELDGSPGTEGSESWTDTVALGDARFYRIKVVTPVSVSQRDDPP